ncbi:MAG: hypothetical protein LBJ01_01965 [Tannerella sp.]|jgi:hypothetical protein|nr:hypothetical protein [Tannerella sp.]
MTQLTTDKITEIYCIADDFCKEFSEEIKKHQILPDDGKRAIPVPFAIIGENLFKKRNVFFSKTALLNHLILLHSGRLKHSI